MVAILFDACLPACFLCLTVLCCKICTGVSIAPIETAKIALQLDSKNVYKNSMGNFIRTTIANKGYSGLFVGQLVAASLRLLFGFLRLSLRWLNVKFVRWRGFLIVPWFPAGYFGIAYRQTSWTAAYFASLESFKQGSSVVIPNSYPKVQAVSSSGSLILPLPRDRSKAVCRRVPLMCCATRLPFSCASSSPAGWRLACSAQCSIRRVT